MKLSVAMEKAQAAVSAGRPREAARLLLGVARAAPGNAQAMFMLGTAFWSMDDRVVALRFLSRAAWLEPGDFRKLAARAEALAATGDHARARDCFRSAAMLRPGDGNIHARLGGLAMGRDKEACVKHLYRAEYLGAAEVADLVNMGWMLRDLGRPGRSVSVLRRALDMNPAIHQAWYNLGNSLSDLGRGDRSASAYAMARAVKPDYYKAVFNHGNELYVLEEYERAQDALAKAQWLDPSQPGPGNNRAVALKNTGRMDEAKRVLADVLDRHPHDLGAIWHLLQMIRVEGEDHERFRALRALDPDKMNRNDAVLWHYAMGKALNDMGEFERAFGHWVRGGRIKRESLPYDEKDTARRFKALERNVTRDVVQDRMMRGFSSELPIFIIGMPRSGTSLMEQILASHPAVFGAGERKFFSQNLGRHMDFGAMDELGRDGFRGLDVEAVGRGYVEALARVAGPEAERVTDKMPLNFQWAGFIRMALPGARIIHIMRDPMDNCLSCFQRFFSEAQQWSYDLRELGRFHLMYQGLMRHWRDVLGDSMLEVRYEDVVEDTEAQARRIIAHAGLEWDPACLDFHKSRRAVVTASATQVRKPIYKTAMGKWRKYGNQLEPLREILESGGR